jgi:D-sedoheptulose 7-phosphate isomerase
MNIEKIIQSSIETKQRILEDPVILEQIREAAAVCINTFQNKGKLLLCGNGGSAADAQHIAAELSGRYQYDREPLYAEALHVNSSFMTAVANDYNFDVVYSRMVKAAGRAGDVLIGISTSGNSANVVKAIIEAKNLGMHTIAFTGEKGGKLAGNSDICIKVPATNTARIQESHILIGHILCEIIETTLFPQEK